MAVRFCYLHAVGKGVGRGRWGRQHRVVLRRGDFRLVHVAQDRLQRLRRRTQCIFIGLLGLPVAVHPGLLHLSARGSQLSPQLLGLGTWETGSRDGGESDRDALQSCNELPFYETVNPIHAPRVLLL